MITRENVTNDDVSRAFGPEVLTCPDCGHGIDPHGVDPGGPCGVSDCPCLLQPNGIACLLIEARVREAQGPCTCPPWHPDMDGPEEDCAQHGRPYASWVEYARELEQRGRT